MQKMQADDAENAIYYIAESVRLTRKQEDGSLIQDPLMAATHILKRTSPERATRFIIDLPNAEQGKAEGEKIILQWLGEHFQQSGDIIISTQVPHDFQAKCRQNDQTSETSDGTYCSTFKLA